MHFINTKNLVTCKGKRIAPATNLLLHQFKSAPQNFLSKEDIRQDVLFDHDASEGTVRQTICTARKDIADSNFEILTITRKGYQLVRKVPPKKPK